MKTISAGGRQYNLYSLTGTILQAQKNVRVNTFSQNLGNRDMIDVNSSVSDRVLLMDVLGKEHDINLTGFDVNCRVGHEITVLWAIKNGKNWGPYFAVKIHDTNTCYYQNGVISDICTPSSMPGIFVLVLLFIACYLMSGLLLALLACFVGFLFLGFFVYNTIISAGVQRFKTQVWS